MMTQTPKTKITTFVTWREFAAGKGRCLDLMRGREERAVKFLFDNFDRFYGYKSLFNFKKKYQPNWQGRYLAYKPGSSLPMVALAVAGVHLPGGFRSLAKS